MAEGNGNGYGNSPTSVDSLEARYRHLDREVGSLREDVASHGAILTQMNNTLQTISERVNRPRETNWQAMIAGAALVFGMAAAYTNLNTAPVRDQLHRVEERQANSLEAGALQQNDYARLMGSLEARLARAEVELAQDDQTFGKLMKLTSATDRRLGFIEGRLSSNPQ